MYTSVNEFYPTPEHLIEKMLFSLDFDMIETVLEPSAGSRNTVEALKAKEKSLSYGYKKYNHDILNIEEGEFY